MTGRMYKRIYHKCTCGNSDLKITLDANNVKKVECIVCHSWVEAPTFIELVTAWNEEHKTPNFAEYENRI